MNWSEEIQGAVEAFLKVARLANEPIDQTDIKIELLDAPHQQPKRLPVGNMAVYAFWGDGVWLKVGKVGPKSAARYTSQHYNAASARSTLAGSLSKCPLMATNVDFEAIDVGLWIKEFCCRANILLPAERPRELLSLLESFLHMRLRPRYEH